MPTLLLLDTSADTATVALTVDNQFIHIKECKEVHQQAAVINVMIKEVMEEAAINLKDIDAIALCGGPGSYTGLRVGFSAAKGLCFALDKPFMLFNKMFLLALTHSDDIAGNILVMLKARAGEAFVAGYDKCLKEIIVPQHSFNGNIKELTAGYYFDKIIDDFENDIFPDREISMITHKINIEKWMKAAEEKFVQRQFEDVAYSEPFYLKQAFTTQPKKKL